MGLRAIVGALLQPNVPKPERAGVGKKIEVGIRLVAPLRC